MVQSCLDVSCVFEGVGVSQTTETSATPGVVCVCVCVCVYVNTKVSVKNACKHEGAVKVKGVRARCTKQTSCVALTYLIAFLFDSMLQCVANAQEKRVDAAKSNHYNRVAVNKLKWGYVHD
jgi:hypothetical protein